jgi:predicted transcriptional regulator
MADKSKPSTEKRRTMPHRTLRELESEVLDRKKRVDDLLLRRRDLTRQVLEIDESIERLTGEPAKKDIRDAEIEAGMRRLDETSDRPVQSLKDYIVRVLRGATEPLTLEQIAERVLAEGYPTESGNFENVVYKTIYRSPNIKKVEGTHTYRIVG